MKKTAKYLTASMDTDGDDLDILIHKKQDELSSLYVDWIEKQKKVIFNDYEEQFDSIKKDFKNYKNESGDMYVYTHKTANRITKLNKLSGEIYGLLKDKVTKPKQLLVELDKYIHRLR